MLPKKILMLVLLAIIFSAGIVSPTDAAEGVFCSADPTAAQVGSIIKIWCTGFDRDTLVNAYAVEPTGFSIIGKSNYTLCLVGTRSGGLFEPSAKTDESGTAAFIWYTQDGSGKHSYPCNYDGYANQIGTYTIVVQQLDGRGGIKSIGQVQITLTGNTETHSGAWISLADTIYSGDTFALSGSGFAPNENVNVWFTRPAACAGLGWWYYTGVSAFDPERWEGAGILGPGTIKADENGNFVTDYSATDHNGSYPCLGQWSVTARALVSGLGAEALFTLNGKSIANNARVWTEEASVPAEGQRYSCGNLDYLCGVAVHVRGSGFPADAAVNCWFTRPDGTVYDGYDANPTGPDRRSLKVDSDGTFSGLMLTYTSYVAYQSEQPGTWKISCGTPDGKYSGAASFTVYALPFTDP